MMFGWYTPLLKCNRRKSNTADSDGTACAAAEEVHVLFPGLGVQNTGNERDTSFLGANIP